jgi:hypothetical protein
MALPQFVALVRIENLGKLVKKHAVKFKPVPENVMLRLKFWANMLSFIPMRMSKHFIVAHFSVIIGSVFWIT